MRKLFFLTALLCASVMAMADRTSQCSGDLGHFATPDNKRISYTIEYLPWADKIRYTVRGYETQVLDFCQIQTTSGNSANLTINEGVAVWQQNAPAAGTDIGVLFLYSTDAIGGNEMNAQSCSLEDAHIVYYKSHDCESSEPEPDPEEIYNVNFALTSQGASATAKSGNNANEAIDNNNGSRWYSAATDGMTDAEKNDQWWQVDLGERRIFNLVQILWEGAWGKSFDIQKSNDGTNWTTIKEIRDQNIPGPFPYLQEIELDANDTARYVRFQGIARGTGYSYSFWEFRVFLVGSRVLTSIELAAVHTLAETNPKVVLAPTEEGIALTVAGKDQVGSPIDAGVIDYEFSAEGVGSLINDKLISANIGGPATITAKSGSIVSNTLVFYGYEGNNLSQGKEVEVSSADTKNPAANAVDNNEASLWSAFSENTSEKEYDAWIIVDLAAFYDINLIAIRWEGACSKHYHVDFSADKETWRTAYNAGWDAIATHWEYLFGTSEDATKVRYVRVYSTEAVSNYGIKIMDLKVFGIPYVPTGDKEKPVMESASLVSNDWGTAIIEVAATDNEGIASYHVVDTTHSYDATFVASAENKITVSGLTPSTEYNLIITALDLSDNESDNSKSVAVTTDSHLFVPTEAAAAPTLDASKVKAIYSPTYEKDCNFQEWGSGTVYSQETYGKKFILAVGGYFGLDGFNYNCSDMDKLHFDFWIADDASVRIVPILRHEVWNEEKQKYEYQNYPEKGVFVNLSGQQWNSINLSLSEGDLASYTDWTETYQVKIDNAANLTLWIGNAYFYKDTATDIDNTEAEVKAVKMIENGQLVIIKNGVKYNVAGQQVK